MLIQDVAWKTYREGWTIGTSGGKGSGKSVLMACYDDDDDNICTHTHIYIYIYTYIYIYRGRKREKIEGTKICCSVKIFNIFNILSIRFFERIEHSGSR